MTPSKKAKATASAEQTGPQKSGSTSYSLSGLPGFSPAPAPDYDTYRKVSAHPTVALVKSIVVSPVIGNTWNYVKRDDAVPDEMVEAVRMVFDPIHNDLVRDCMKALEMGWSPFEVIWKNAKDLSVIVRCKPLIPDNTSPVVDEHGNLEGLINKSPHIGKVALADEKYFAYTYDSQSGDPLGRSRHDNVIKVWHESEQIRERLAQYMRKVSSIIPVLHYPEGTLRDSSGADRSTEYLAQKTLDAVSQGHGIMFPNLFASEQDPRKAADLAGKSSWLLTFVDPGGADYAPGFHTILEYYDSLIFRAWLRPERVGLESRHGSRADAVAHTDTGTRDCELIDRDIAEAINRQLVNKFLELNFGEDAVGAVRIEPNPIEDNSVQIYQTLVDAILSNSLIAQSVSNKIDVPALLDAMGVPVLDQEEATPTVSEPVQASNLPRKASSTGALEPMDLPDEPDPEVVKKLKKHYDDEEDFFLALFKVAVPHKFVPDPKWAGQIADDVEPLVYGYIAKAAQQRLEAYQSSGISQTAPNPSDPRLVQEMKAAASRISIQLGLYLTATTADQINKAADKAKAGGGKPKDVEAAVKAVFDQARDNWASGLAQQQQSGAMHEGMKIAATATGFICGFRFTTMPGCCDECLSHDGDIIRTDGSFTGDPNALFLLPLHMNCRCSAVEVPCHEYTEG